MISHIIKERRKNKYKNTLLLKIQTLQENKKSGQVILTLFRVWGGGAKLPPSQTILIF